MTDKNGTPYVNLDPLSSIELFEGRVLFSFRYQSLKTDARAVKLIEQMSAEPEPPEPGHADFVSEWAVILSCYAGHSVTPLYREGELVVLDNLLNCFSAYLSNAIPIWQWRVGLSYGVLEELRRAIRLVGNQWVSAVQRPGNLLTAEEKQQLEDPNSPLA